MSHYTWLYHPVPKCTRRLPNCSICNHPVLLETSNTDENGQAVHEECYVLKVCLGAEFLNSGRYMRTPENWHALYQPREATLAESWESPMPKHPAVLATTLMQRAKRIPWFNRLWNVDVAAVVTILVVTCWIAYSDRHPASFLGSLELQRSIAIEQQGPLPPAKGRSKLQTVPVPVDEARTSTLFQRVVEENEVVDIGEDVTVRYFTPKPAPHRVSAGQYQVVHIGEDVTVRYFAPKPAPHRVPAGQYQVVHIGEDVTVRYFTPISRHTRN